VLTCFKKKNYHSLWYELQEFLILFANHTSANQSQSLNILKYLLIDQKIVFTFEIPNYIIKFYLFLIYSIFLKKTLAK